MWVETSIYTKSQLLMIWQKPITKWPSKQKPENETVAASDHCSTWSSQTEAGWAKTDLGRASTTVTYWSSAANSSSRVYSFALDYFINYTYTRGPIHHQTWSHMKASSFPHGALKSHQSSTHTNNLQYMHVCAVWFRTIWYICFVKILSYLFKFCYLVNNYMVIMVEVDKVPTLVFPFSISDFSSYRLYLQKYPRQYILDL